MKEEKNDVVPPVDIWRETGLRYLGYANEVGEAFGPIYPRYVRPSYGVAFLYVGCDTVDKANKSVKRGDDNQKVLKETADALIWQTLASVLIPGKIINVITNGSVVVVNKSLQSSTIATAKSVLMKRWAPTAIVLAAIPFIIHPIDHAVDYLMDNTVRKWWE